MSRVRKTKKTAREVVLHYLCHDGITWRVEVMTGPSAIRHAVSYQKRKTRDPFFLVSQDLVQAPVKYSRCRVCAGAPHHSPWFGRGRG